VCECLHKFVFAYYPYFAFFVFIIGSIARYNYDQYSWNASSTQLLASKGMWIGNNLFHIGIILLFFGHFIGLLMPTELYTKWITCSQKQVLAMTFGGMFGGLCFIGMSILIYRHLFDVRVRAISSIMDSFILFLLYIQLILGLLTIVISTKHLDGYSMVLLSHWVQYIVTFQPGAADFLVGQHWLFKLHLFLGITIFLVFPFTRLVHIWSVPIGYLLRNGYQIVRKLG